MSLTGKTRNTKMLAEDIQKYYKKIGLNDVASMYQIQRTLLGNRCDFSIVCQIAFYLGISIDSLLHPSLSEKQILNVQETRCSKEERPEDWNQYDEDMVPVLEKLPVIFTMAILTIQADQRGFLKDWYIGWQEYQAIGWKIYPSVVKYWAGIKSLMLKTGQGGLYEHIRNLRMRMEAGLFSGVTYEKFQVLRRRMLM